MAASLEHVLAQIQHWTSPGLEEFSDAVLLERFVRRRDEPAFTALVARHGAMVLRSCRRVLHDDHDAEMANCGVIETRRTSIAGVPQGAGGQTIA